MAIKIKGDTIINDGRIIVNADKIGIGTTNPQVALEIFNGDVGIGTTNPSASNIESALNTNDNVLAVGIVTAREYYGTFKGTIDPSVADDRIQQGNTKAQVVDNGSDGHFLVETEGSERLRITSTGFIDIGGSSTAGIAGVTNPMLYAGFKQTGSAPNNTFGGVILGAGLNGNSPTISASKNNSGTALSLLFETDATERLRITADGHLKPGATDAYDIGTDANNRFRAVYAKEFRGGTFYGTIDPGTSVVTDKIEEGNSSVEVIDPNSNLNAVIQTVVAGTVKQRILSSGQVNIIVEGTGLNISGSNTSGMELKVPNASSTQNRDTYLDILNENDHTIAKQVGQVQADGGSAWIWKTQISGARNTSRIEERLRITADGHVGIGTTNPVASNIESALEFNTKVLAVGIVTANEYYGSFKGNIDPGTSISKAVKADRIKITEDDAASGNLLFQSGTSSASTFNVTVTAPSFNFYTLSGSDRTGSVSGNNQPVTINVGDTINFNLSNVANSHPFYIKSALGSGSNTQVSTPAASGQGSTGNSTVSWTPNTSGTYYYQCGSHSTMNGTITVRDEYFSVLSDNDLSYNSSTNLLTVEKIKPTQILDTSNGTGTQDYVIKANGSGGWTWGQVEGGSVGTLNFTDLNDTPANYTGHAHKLVRVNKDGTTNNGTALEFVNASSLSNTYDLSVQQSASGNDGNPFLRLSDGTTDDDIKIVGGANVTVTRNSATELTIAAVNGAGVGVAASVSDVLNIHSGDIGAVDAGGDKIVFWDDGADPSGDGKNYGKLTYLSIDSNTLEIDNTTLKVKVAGVSGYRQEAASDGNNVKLRLEDIGAGTFDDILLTKGDGITFTDVSSAGFKINSTGGGNVATSIQTFTTAGTFTYTPTSGTTSIIVHVIGAGGASGTPKNYAWTGGGGAGGVAIKTYNLTELGANASVVVPAASGYDTFPNANNGPDGGNASFNPSGTGATIIGYGGKGSSSKEGGGVNGNNQFSEGGDGGAATNGDLNYTGEKGVVIKDASWNHHTLIADWRVNASSSASRYQISRAKPAAGGYGNFGLGGESTFTTATDWNNGRGGTVGAVLVYEFAGASGGSGGYSQEVAADGNNIKLRLKDVSAGTFDDILLTKGDGITFSGVSADGFTISASGGGSGGGTIGEVVAWSGLMTDSDIPSGYFLCDGRSLNKNTYAALFAITGYIHGGSGDNFNIPDLRDKFIVGAYSDGSDTTYPQVKPSATGGSANAVLIAHNHDITANSSESSQNDYFGGSTANYGVNASGAGDVNYTGTIKTKGQTSTGANSTSQTGTNANLPPYYALAYIINATSGSGSGGGSIHVQDEGTELSGIATTLNFTGALVQATNDGSDSDIKNITISGNFTDLEDTPANYTGQDNKFVRVNADGDGLEFSTQSPTTGAAGADTQIQYNDGSTLQGAKFVYIKGNESTGDPSNQVILKPNYTDFASSSNPAKYGGGSITVQSNDISSTISTPWNRASINSDGSLELLRRRSETPEGGPFIDFKSQLDGSNNPVDKDARIQMDYALESSSINTNSGDYSAISFQTGGISYYHWQNATSGRVTEKIRIGRNGEIGILAGSQIPSPNQGPYNNIQPGTAGSNNPIVASNRTDAQKYGTAGQVLMSDGKGKTVYWGTNGTGGNLWSQNANGIYRDSDVMIRRSDNANDASLAVLGNTLSGNVGTAKTVLDLKNINNNADCLTFHNIRLTQDNNTPPSWYSAAWRIQRRVDVTDQCFIQFGGGNGNTSDSNEDLIFGNANKELLRIKDGGTTFANHADVTLNGGGGVAVTGAVEGAINLGSSYRNATHGAGSGSWEAIKLYVYKDSSIDNVYGLGISNGMMEIQSNAKMGFFAGTSGAGTGSRPLRMIIDANGNIGVPSNGNVIYSASDSRLKKNVVTLDKGLSEINSLRPVSFNWIDGYCQNDKDKLYGFLAQEVQTVDSNLVSSFGTTPVGIGTDPLNPTQTITDPLTVDEKFIVPMLVKAVQELSAKNDALEARISALEG